MAVDRFHPHPAQRRLLELLERAEVGVLYRAMAAPVEFSEPPTERARLCRCGHDEDAHPGGGACLDESSLVFAGCLCDRWEPAP